MAGGGGHREEGREMWLCDVIEADVSGAFLLRQFSVLQTPRQAPSEGKLPVVGEYRGRQVVAGSIIPPFLGHMPT